MVDAPALDVAGDIAPPDAHMTGASPTVGAVFFMTLLMAAASGLGAVPFFFVRRLSPRLAALANALACGVMLAASFDLVHEGEPHGALLVVVGVCLGAVFIALTQRALRDQEDVRFGLLRGADARKTLLMVGIMTAHSLGEGSGVGVSFGGERGWTQGTLVTLAIGAHNVPEGMAVATVLAARGVSPWKCAGWAVVTSLPQPLLAVPAFVFVETFAALLPLGMGFAAGCMIWITVAELLPDALEAADASAVATTATIAAAALEAFRMWTEALERADAASLGVREDSRSTHRSIGLENESKGTYGVKVPTGESVSTDGAEPKPRRHRAEPGRGETLTTGSFVPAERSSGGESAAEALDRLAAASTERKAAAMRAAEFARASVGGDAAQGAGVGVGLSATETSTGAASSGDAAAVAALALATLVVPLLCFIAAAAVPRLLPFAEDAAPSSATRSKRFRGAFRAGGAGGGALGFAPERAELLGAAAGAAAAVGFGRLADAFRRCRFGDAPWLPAAVGAVVGALAHLLLAERALGRAEAEARRGDAKKDVDDVFENDENERVFEDDPERASGVGFKKNAPETRSGGLWTFRGAHAVLVWTCAWACASEGASLAVAAAAHGGHAALPAAARTFPKACVVGWSALAAGADRWAAARAVFFAAAAQPLALLVAWRFGFGAAGWVDAGWASANAVAFQAATAAALLAAATRTAAPAARRRNRSSADGGAAFGAALVCIALAALGGLCWQTPYCDRSW
jgi:zinc transporter ZupT